MTADELLERFRAELTALGVMHRVVDTEANVRSMVAAMIEGHRVLMWHPEHLPYGLGESVVGILEGARHDIQAKADIGLTGCDAAIAETGTLALIGGPGRGRTVSLLPPVHLAVMSRTVLCLGMGDFFSLHGGGAAAANVSFITGSRGNSGAELTGASGAHADGRLIVVIGP